MIKFTCTDIGRSSQDMLGGNSVPSPRQSVYMYIKKAYILIFICCLLMEGFKNRLLICLQERKLGGPKFEIKGVILLFTLWVL